MIRAVLLDLSGVLYVGDQAVDGAVASVNELKVAGIPHCFITNTTRRTQQAIVSSLNKLGFDIASEDILTAASATLDYIKEHHLKPHSLVHANLKEQFSVIESDSPDTVVLGDAAEDFNYLNLNRAFRVLMQHEGNHLVSMGYNRYFRESGGLSLDLGAFTAALEFASGRQAIIMGKPSADFFLQAVSRLDREPSQVLMIGDDVESNVNGALDAGLQACLVKTGKYQSGDEQKIKSEKAWLVEDVNQAIERVILQSSS